KEALGIKPLPFSIGLGTFMGGAGTITGGGMGILQQFSTLSMGMTGIKTLTGMATGADNKVRINEQSRQQAFEERMKNIEHQSKNQAPNAAAGDTPA
ncbi:MAG: hypothetical protein NTV98_05240, partial [Candidatus Roizmanbacteria bacterium]|nr:hypothetical protein [Candidatus Roizmanbacteria bacterium]